ncbi:sensor histidine kinase [Devosia nitrariae]|uniref:histidine kinase n=1 Tax=Devosia nitrariae TaxID=2071872 RepID=A0ABQ5W6R8_9HYPH|nr:HWE histidine kinase domain-containing protein [Devosia nitrariae]GLQ55738.1 histidine kinase [Devosia nitrariae]
MNDISRREVLAALEIMDTGEDSDFDRLARVAGRLFGVEFALVTLVDEHRQWAKARIGPPELSEMAVEHSFCAHAIAALESDHLVVTDLASDKRFAHHPMVAGPPGLRFYAGAPLVVRGQRLGTLCVLDRVTVNAPQGAIAQLVDLADVAAKLIELKDEARVRARTAAELMREEWRHALTLEAGKVGSWVWDVRNGDVSCNDTFRRMHGLPETGAVSFEEVLAAIEPADMAKVREAIGASFDAGVDYACEMRIAATGRWLSVRGRVYQRDASGQPLIMMGASLDVTEARESAERTRSLLRELNHRVKNTLAVIQSVARQTIGENPEPQAFIAAFSGRLRTLSDAHVLLADRDWAGVHLYDVIAGQLGPDFLTRPDRASVAGEDILLPADHALGLGLILHELTTNAHLHGAWSNEEGVVDIRWEVRRQPVTGLALTWREAGGPAVAQPATPGLGTRLIERSLSKVLDSRVTLTFEPDGVRADVWMPLPASF